MDKATQTVIELADKFKDRIPTLETLYEEFAELILSSRGKHEHSTWLELSQVASISINLMRRLDRGEDINKK